MAQADVVEGADPVDVVEVKALRTIMTILSLMFRELWERRARLATSLLALTLAVAVLVAVETITSASKRGVEVQMQSLGANLVVLPQAARTADFYMAQFGSAHMPAEYADRLQAYLSRDLFFLFPRLSLPFRLGGRKILLHGITVHPDALSGRTGGPPGPGRVLVGHILAQQLGLQASDPLPGTPHLHVQEVLPSRGTWEDISLFADLSFVQQWQRRGPVINVIEVGVADIGRLEVLADRIRELLPGTKVLTVPQLAKTQSQAQDSMRSYALFLGLVVLLVSGLHIANQTVRNVHERRREIGMLLALGATPSVILRLFLGRALILGVAGGILGYGLGLTTGFLVGTRLPHAVVSLQVELLLLAFSLAVGISLLCSALPASYASRLDPALNLQEE